MYGNIFGAHFLQIWGGVVRIVFREDIARDGKDFHNLWQACSLASESPETFGNRPNTVSEITVSDIELSEFFRSRPGKPNQRKGQNEKFMNFTPFL